MKNWVGKRCLILGGAGTLGTALAQELLDAGAKVTVVDDLSNPESKNSPVFNRDNGVHFIYRRVEDIVSHPNLWQCDTVFQLARSRHESDLSQILTNLALATSISNAVAKWRPGQVIFITNDSPEDSTVELLAEKLTSERGIKTSTVRIDPETSLESAAKTLKETAE